MLIGFVGAVVVLNLVPGPGMMYLLAHGITGGRKAGAIAALGMATGTVVHTAAAILGLSALLTAAPFVLDGVRIFGALVLAYLAFAALCDSRALNNEPKQKPESILRTYISAVLTNLANPKVMLFYVAFMPQFIHPGEWPTSQQVALLGIVVILVGLVMDMAVGIAAGTFSTLLFKRPSVQRWLQRIAALIFGSLASRLLTQVR